MRKIIMLLMALPVALLCNIARAQSDAEMKAMMAYATPGDVHKMLAASVGEWTASANMWNQPGTAPMQTTFVTKNEMLLGGRYLQSTNTGSFNGMPFTGISTTAYDNSKKLFVNTWIDNMGTGITVLSGPWNDQDKSITLTGTMVDPGTGKDIPVREVLRYPDNNTQTMEMYMKMGDKEFKNMEIVFKRK